MKATQFNPIIAGLALALAAPVAWAHCAGNHGPGHPHCQGAGQEDPVFEAESANPGIPTITSYSVFQETTVQFRHAQIDLTAFEGTWPDGTPCNHGAFQGSFSIKPLDGGGPDAAVLTSSFQSQLDDGETTGHRFVMEGMFDPAGDWPPTPANPVMDVTFDYWEVMASNKKAQRSDCAGESATVPDGPFTVTVELISTP